MRSQTDFSTASNSPISQSFIDLKDQDSTEDLQNQVPKIRQIQEQIAEQVTNKIKENSEQSQVQQQQIQKNKPRKTSSDIIRELKKSESSQEKPKYTEIDNEEKCEQIKKEKGKTQNQKESGNGFLNFIIFTLVLVEICYGAVLMTINEIIETRGNDTIYILGIFTIVSALVMLFSYIKKTTTILTITMVLHVIQSYLLGVSAYYTFELRGQKDAYFQLFGIGSILQLVFLINSILSYFQIRKNSKNDKLKIVYENNRVNSEKE